MFRGVMAPPLIPFFVLAFLLVITSLMVVFQRNVVHSALSLVAALFLIALFFIMLHAPMVGVLQILIYAGAIMVLFLFVIMLLNPAALEQRRGVWWWFGTEPAPDPAAATALFGSPEMLAKSLFTDFVLPFEIASILLLVAIVGAVVLAKREP